MFNFTTTLIAVELLAILLAILVPFMGALARFRAHYNPKGLQLDPEDTDPVITSFFAMLVRVYRIEGWPGLYKGLMPALLPTSIATLFLLLFLNNSSLRFAKHNFFRLWSSVLGMLAYSLFTTLILLPKGIITARAITTPHKLPYFNAIYSLRILLTPTERRKPWILYLTPGLLAAHVSRVAYTVLLQKMVQQLLPKLARSGFPHWDVSVVRLAIFFVLALASTVVLTPLEVISIRLAIQRNHVAPEFNSVAQEEDDDAEGVEYSGANEDVIGLRTEREPYTGLIDCATKIIDEEGWSALYRAWWFTMFCCLAVPFSS